jgi:hypothetical protein
VRSGCDGPGTWPVEALGARLSGAHDLERHGGVAFRWLRPAAALVTDLPPGDWRLVLHTGGIGRDPTSVRVRARLDGRRIDVEARTDGVVVEGRARRGLQVWTLVVDALAAAGDDRRLGLPLAAVTAC